jgi:hypothetical protein
VNFVSLPIERTQKSATTPTHLFGINNYNMIPHVLVWPECWLVLSLEDLGDLPCQATDGLIFGVNEMPRSL